MVNNLLITKKTWLLLVLIFLFSFTGCNRFTIGENLSNKNIIYDKKKSAFFIHEQDLKREIKIYHKQKIAPIFCVIQNKDKSLAAVKVTTLSSKKYAKDNKVVIMPQRFILIISGNQVIFSLDSPELTSIQWLDNSRLRIISDERKLVVNEKGKIVSDEKYSPEQFTYLPRETIF